MNLWEHGCVPFYDTESYSVGIPQVPECKPEWNRMLDFAISTLSIHNVVRSFPGPLKMLGEGLATRRGYGSSDASFLEWRSNGACQADVFASHLQDTLRRLAATCKRAVLSMDWPELGFDPKSCLPRPVRVFSSGRSFCGISDLE